ncbi:MAG TPA: mechanosensitive ion channel domain-containing protein [Burkholderiales bacterium]|nr:mechanosensitive ion channel domain-containing protein [Burkholderiales bacterium]
MNGEMEALWRKVWSDLHDPSALWQIGAIAACLLLAWVAERVVVRRAPETPESRTAKVGLGGLRRVVFPLVAVLLVLIARPILQRFGNVALLDLAVPLLGSLAVVRIAVYLLRVAFGTSSLIAAFERAIATTVWGLFALHILGLLPGAIATFESITLPVGKARISLWDLGWGIVGIAFTILAALWLGGVIEARLMRAVTLHANVRVALARIAKTLLVFLAVVIALPLAGLDLTLLSVFGGALGVGLGFGLQKIASNYVSGFIVLLDRSIRLGDLITADNFYGVVKEMTTRYTVVKALDGREAIIPNETLITSTVLNHSNTEKRVRIPLQVQVGYTSDAEQVLRLCEDVARAHPRVLRDPAPSAAIAGLGDSGLNLELGFWISWTRDPAEGTLGVRSDIALALLKAFRERGIEIPFPQRTVRILHQPASEAAGDGMRRVAFGTGQTGDLP